VPATTTSHERSGTGHAAALLQLRVLDTGQRVRLDPTLAEVLYLGSRASNDVVLKGQGVSRRHARLIGAGDSWLIEDLGSRNGILVEGELTDVHVLAAGDELQLGMARLRVEEVRDPWFSRALALLGDPEALGERFEDRRVLAGVASAFALLLALVLLVGGDEPSVRTVRADTQLEGLASPAAALMRGDARAAARGFRRLAIHATVAQRRTPRTLQRLAEVYQGDPRSPDFRWQPAARRLSQAKALDGLPPQLAGWIDEQLAWVGVAEPVAQALGEARALAARAADLASGGADVEAAEAYEAAHRSYAALDPDGPFGALLASEAAPLRERAHGLLLAAAETELDRVEPDHEAAVALLQRAAAGAPDERRATDARRKLLAAEAEQRDLASYAQAVQVLSERRLEDYARATKLLGQIGRRSRVYEEAQAWLSWAEADGLTREAEVLYDQGDVGQALRVLDRAGAGPLGPKAEASLRARRQHWSTVRASYERGLRASREGRVREAKADLGRVLALEPRPLNQLHRRAKDELSYLARSQRGDQQRVVRRGLAALERGDYAAALRAFEHVRRDPRRQSADGATIAQAVRRAARERSLLQRARDDMHGDRADRFPQIRDVLELLWRWLHPRNLDRAEAGRMLKIVEADMERREIVELIQAVGAAGER
jgi:hypothetical protein